MKGLPEVSAMALNTIAFGARLASSVCMIEHIEIDERLAARRSRALVDARPERALPQRRRPAGARRVDVPARVLHLELPIELEDLTAGEDRGMGIEHEVEQGRAAVTGAGDIDDAHSTQIPSGPAERCC